MWLDLVSVVAFLWIRRNDVPILMVCLGWFYPRACFWKFFHLLVFLFCFAELLSSKIADEARRWTWKRWRWKWHLPSPILKLKEQNAYIIVFLALDLHYVFWYISVSTPAFDSGGVFHSLFFLVTGCLTQCQALKESLTQEGLFKIEKRVWERKESEWSLEVKDAHM